MNIYGAESADTNISLLEVSSQDAVHLLNIPCDVFFETNCRIVNISEVAYQSGYFTRVDGRSVSRVRVCIGLGLFLAKKRRVCTSLFLIREREYLNADDLNCC